MIFICVSMQYPIWSSTGGISYLTKTMVPYLRYSPNFCLGSPQQTMASPDAGHVPFYMYPLDGVSMWAMCKHSIGSPKHDHADFAIEQMLRCLLYTSPSPRD